MKKFARVVAKSLVSILIGSGVLAANLEAQSDEITVRVPFPFTVCAQSIAPGTFQFGLVSDRGGFNQFLLSVLNVKTGVTEICAVRPEWQRTIEQHAHVTFHDSEGRSILTEVHFPGNDLFTELVQRRSEKIDTKRASTTDSASMTRR